MTSDLDEFDFPGETSYVYRRLWFDVTEQPQFLQTSLDFSFQHFENTKYETALDSVILYICTYFCEFWYLFKHLSFIFV